MPTNKRDIRSIPPMTRLRRGVDILISLALIFPSNMVTPNFIKSYNLHDIGVGKLLAEKNELILTPSRRITI